MTALLVPAPVAAQSVATADLAAGYSLLRLIEEPDELNLPTGWFASAGVRAKSWIWIVGEVAGNYKTYSDGDSLWVHTYQGGPRVVLEGSRINVFGHLLLGALTVRGSEGNEADSETRFAIEPGGGVDVVLNNRTAVRVGAAFPMFFIDEEDFQRTVNFFRFEAGVVFRFGRR
jgi:hypothetical protein